MFKTFQTATNAGEPSREIILNLSAIRCFEPSLTHQIGKTVIDLVGRLQDVHGRVNARSVAVKDSAQDVAAMFDAGKVFLLHVWDSRTGTEWDGRAVYLPLAQVRSVEPFGDTVLIQFSDGSDIRVKRDDQAETFLNELAQSA